MKAECEPKYVRFSRFVMTLLIASYALFGLIEGMYIMLIMTLSTLLLTSKYSLPTLLYKILTVVKFDKVFRLNPRYERSFCIDRRMELFEEGLRLFVGLMTIALYHSSFMISSIVLAFFMAVMMLISTYFGFCVTGLLYIAYSKIIKRVSHG